METQYEMAYLPVSQCKQTGNCELIILNRILIGFMQITNFNKLTSEQEGEEISRTILNSPTQNPAQVKLIEVMLRKIFRSWQGDSSIISNKNIESYSMSPAATDSPHLKQQNGTG